MALRWQKVSQTRKASAHTHCPLRPSGASSAFGACAERGGVYVRPSKPFEDEGWSEQPGMPWGSNPKETIVPQRNIGAGRRVVRRRGNEPLRLVKR